MPRKKIAGGCQGITQKGQPCKCKALEGGCYCRYHGGLDLLYPAKKAFQLAANAYRKKNCDNRARPLEFGEFHLGCHNYTGPGTQIAKYRNYPPYNDIDNCSRNHDIAYEIADKQKDPKLHAQAIRKADIEAVECYDKFPKESGYTAARLGINGKINFEKALPIIAKSIIPEGYLGGRKKRAAKILPKY